MTTLSTVTSAEVLQHINGEPRTAQQVTVALFGPQDDGAKWWLVSTRLDWLVAHNRLSTRKVNHVSVYWKVV